MDCHGGAAVSQALGAHVVTGHVPQGGLEDDAMAGMQDPALAMALAAGGEEAWMRDFTMHGGSAAAQHHHHQQQQQQHHQYHQEGDEEWAAHFHAGAEDPMLREFLAQQMANEGAAQEQEERARESGAAGDWAAQFERQEGEEWAADYNNDDVQVFTAPGEQLRTVEEKAADSKFYDLMGKVRRGEVVINEEAGMLEAGPSPAVAGMNEGEFLNEYMNQHSLADVMAAHSHDPLAASASATDDDGDAWAEQMRQRGEAGFEQAWGSDDGDFMEQYMRENRDMAEEFLEGEIGESGEDWMREYQEMTKRFTDAQDSTDYPFDSNNPYLFHDNPFEEGLQLLAAGTLSEAVLAFEAVCQKEPERVEGWQYLGTTQAENEKDHLAIRALNKARQLSPANLAVLMSLAVSHTNETNHTQALQSLRAWVLAHQEYEMLGGVAAVADPAAADAGAVDEPDFAREFLFVSASEHRAVCNLFNAALEINASDAELYAGLGILRNLSHEYDLAAENFSAALKVRPNDEKLWNKLGATLANGNRSQEALAAYDKALDLNPGYVRAQYNLGIAHSNLGDHNMAARQFLRAIVMQQGGIEVPDPPTRSTKEIWDVLRMTFNLMERPDLVEKTWGQNVAVLLDEFGLQDLA